MRQLKHLVLFAILLCVPFTASASGQELMQKSYLKLENILHFMEYSSAVELECATVYKGQAYKNWLMYNISKLKVLTKIQNAYHVKAAVMGDQVAAKYFQNEASQRQLMVNKAVNMISNGSDDVKRSLCRRLQDMVVASEDRTQVDSDLNYLVKNESKILKAIANNANW